MIRISLKYEVFHYKEAIHKLIPKKLIFVDERVFEFR